MFSKLNACLMISREASNFIDNYFILEDAFYDASDGILSF